MTLLVLLPFTGTLTRALDFLEEVMSGKNCDLALLPCKPVTEQDYCLLYDRTGKTHRYAPDRGTTLLTRQKFMLCGCPAEYMLGQLVNQYHVTLVK